MTEIQPKEPAQKGRECGKMTRGPTEYRKIFFKMNTSASTSITSPSSTFISVCAGMTPISIDATKSCNTESSPCAWWPVWSIIPEVSVRVLTSGWVYRLGMNHLCVLHLRIRTVGVDAAPITAVWEEQRKNSRLLHARNSCCLPCGKKRKKKKSRL